MTRTYASIPFAHQVLEALRGRKTVTADELVPLFPGKGKKEVVKALQNAELRGFVKLDRSAGRSRSDAGYYAPGVARRTNADFPDPPVPAPAGGYRAPTAGI